MFKKFEKRKSLIPIISTGVMVLLVGVFVAVRNAGGTFAAGTGPGCYSCTGTNHYKWFDSTPTQTDNGECLGFSGGVPSTWTKEAASKCGETEPEPTPSSYKVEFDLNGGSGSISSQTVESGDTVSRPGSPTRTGYKFKYWSTSKNGSLYDFSTPVTESFTLYAIWESYEGCYYCTSSGTYKYFDSKPDNGECTTLGNNVPGEWQRASDSNCTSGGGGTTEPDVPPTPTSYTVKFDLNGGSGSISSQTVESGKSASKPSNPTRTGYTFKYWSTSKSGSEYNFSTKVAGNLTLYAVWQVNTVTIKYKTNDGIITKNTSGGTWTTDSAGLISKDGTVYIDTVNYGLSMGINGLANYNNNNFINITKTGYSAPSGAEWKCLSGNCKQNTYNQQGAIAASNLCDASKGSCTVILGVNWQINTVTIKYKTNGGKIQKDNSEGPWTTDSAGLISKSGTVYIDTVNYGSSMNTSGLANYNNKDYINITKTGYSAPSGAEWKCLSGNCKQNTYNQQGAIAASNLCDASKESCTIILGVNWQIATFTVDYNVNGGSGGLLRQTVEYGKTATKPSTNPTKDKMAFNGWATAATCKPTEMYDFSTKVTKNITLYACYKDVNSTAGNNNSNTGDNNSNIDDNVDNPKTGSVLIGIAWLVGIGALGYTVYYFRKRKTI